MQVRSVIVLVIDGLGAGHLGPYGNTWIDTPALNRLASESFLLEQAVIDTPELARLYRSYWQGLHATCGEAPPDRPPLAKLLEDAGVATVLLTDEPEVADHPLATAFSDCRQIPLPEEAYPADEIHDTHVARLFAAADDCLSQAGEPFLLWVHARGMYSPWDAPLVMRNQFADEDDPTPPTFADVPCRMLETDFDPDELLGVVQAYAGQVTLLDTCIGALTASLAEDTQGDETALILTSSRGFPLGEHGRIGAWDEALYSETVHVPWMMRLPGAAGAMARCQALVQPADLNATLLDWFGTASDPAPGGGHSLLPLVAGKSSSVRDRAFTTAGGERSIRTADWFLRSADVDELFAKPDDRWDANEVADRCQDVVERLRTELEESGEW